MSSTTKLTLVMVCVCVYIYSAYRNGRVNLVELHELVNVDLTVVENTVADMLKTDGQLTLVQGDLIDRYRCLC